MSGRGGSYKRGNIFWPLRARLGRVILLLAVLISLNSCITLKGLRVDYSESRLSQGGLALVHLRGAGAHEQVSSVFTGGYTLIVKEKKDGAWAIIAADLESEAGQYHIIFREGKREISSGIRLTTEDFGTDRLTLPADMTEFNEATLARISRERATLKKVFAESAPNRLWRGAFIRPLSGRISGAFGRRRILNGELRRPHGGLDIAAPKGTTVLASGGGRVAFVGDFFFYGNLVVIDHGQGLFTLYAHLDSVLIKKGDTLKAGEAIGLVGATGRATGPHLHFALLVGPARVSPLDFIRLTERLQRLMGGGGDKGGGGLSGVKTRTD